MSKAKFEITPDAAGDRAAAMFMIPAFDVEPNSNFMQWVAAEYEAEYACNEISEHGPKYVAASERAVMNAWNRMMDRPSALDPFHPRNVKE